MGLSIPCPCPFSSSPPSAMQTPAGEPSLTRSRVQKVSATPATTTLDSRFKGVGLVPVPPSACCREGIERGELITEEAGMRRRHRCRLRGSMNPQGLRPHDEKTFLPYRKAESRVRIYRESSAALPHLACLCWFIPSPQIPSIWGRPYPPFPLSPPFLPDSKTTRLMHTIDTPHIHHYRLLPLLSRPPFLPTPHKSNPDLFKTPVFETSTAHKSPRTSTHSISTSTSISNLLLRYPFPPFLLYTFLKQHYPPFTCRALISWPAASAS